MTQDDAFHIYMLPLPDWYLAPDIQLCPSKRLYKCVEVLVCCLPQVKSDIVGVLVYWNARRVAAWIAWFRERISPPECVVILRVDVA